MAAGDLTTLANAMRWLGQTSGQNNDVIQRLISAISGSIQKFLGFQVASASYSRTFNGVGGQRLMLPDRPVTAVAGLTIDDVTVPASTSAFAGGFVFDDKRLFLRGCYEFCRGAQNITVSYTAGYATTPFDIEQACLDWVKITFDNLDTLPGISKIKAGDTEIDYGEDIALLGSTTLLMPPIVAAKLQPYRRIAPA